jgi:hypothetical protein
MVASVRAWRHNGRVPERQVGLEKGDGVTEPRSYEKGFLIQGTLTKGILMSVRVYAFTGLTVRVGVGEIMTADSAQLCFEYQIFDHSLQMGPDFNEEKLLRRMLTEPLKIFYNFVLDLGGLEEILQKLYQDQGYPWKEARKRVGAHMRHLRAAYN